MDKEKTQKRIAENRKAFHDYFIEEAFEASLENLEGDVVEYNEAFTWGNEDE